MIKKNVTIAFISSLVTALCVAGFFFGYFPQSLADAAVEKYENAHLPSGDTSDWYVSINDSYVLKKKDLHQEQENLTQWLLTGRKIPPGLSE